MNLFATKSIDTLLAEADGEKSLKRTLSAMSLVALGIGAIIGAGIFTLTGVAAATHAGPAMVYSFIIAAVGGLGLTTSMSLSVMERRREMGMLRAIGASHFVVMGIIGAEGIVIGVMSSILAALAAWPLSRIAGDFLTGPIA